MPSGPAEWETEAYRTRFVQRVEELVAHFKDRTYPIKHWEIWNEEDLSLEGFDVRIEPRPYALLLIAAYDAIKSIDGFPVVLANELKHCILAHHGELEFGSPKKPALVEALALSFADNIDAKMETFRELLVNVPENDTKWQGYNRFMETNFRRTSV